MSLFYYRNFPNYLPLRTYSHLNMHFTSSSPLEKIRSMSTNGIAAHKMFHQNTLGLAYNEFGYNEQLFYSEKTLLIDINVKKFSYNEYFYKEQIFVN